MTIRCVAKIMETSTARRNEYAFLLAVADHAHDDGTGAWPSNATLAGKLRVTTTAVKNIRARCVAKGLVRVRCELSSNSTRILDLVFEDGSNADVIASLYNAPESAEGGNDLTGGGKKVTGGGKFLTPNLVVVDSSISESRNTNNNKDSGQLSCPPPQETYPPLSEDDLDAAETDALLAEWREWRVVGEYLRPIAARILQRATWRQELDVLYAYPDLKGGKVGAGWLAAELRALATLPAAVPSAWTSEPGEIQDDWHNAFLDWCIERGNMAQIMRVVETDVGIRFLFIRGADAGAWAIMRGRSIGGEDFETLPAAVQFEIKQLSDNGQREAAESLASRFNIQGETDGHHEHFLETTE